MNTPSSAISTGSSYRTPRRHSVGSEGVFLIPGLTSQSMDGPIPRRKSHRLFRNLATLLMTGEVCLALFNYWLVSCLPAGQLRPFP